MQAKLVEKWRQKVFEELFAKKCLELQVRQAKVEVKSEVDELKVNLRKAAN